MEFWNNIINTALLGTDKKQISENELLSDIEEACTILLNNQETDKEEKFLQVGIVVANYRRSGISALTRETVSIKQAATEEKQYCNVAALQALKDILDEQSVSLLKWWLYYCNRNNKIVTPEFIPALFEIANTQKKLQAPIAACCGKRGEWLSSFNTDWNFYKLENDEEVWQNGTMEQRKKILQKIRNTEPAKGREWLQQTWSQENANTKTELLKQIATNISEADTNWLETLLEEKSQKVKDAALGLLQQIPTSSIVLGYWKILQQSIILKKEKALLGMVSKTFLQISLEGSNENIFTTGIEKLSNTKELSDDEFILYQLIQFIPPKNWETHFDSSPENIISYFKKDKTAQKLLPAFAQAIIQFKDIDWAKAIMQDSEVPFVEVLSILPEQLQDKYAIKFFEKESQRIIQIAKERETEWSIDLTKTIFKFTAQHFYQYNKQFYNDCIHLIPAEIVNYLEKCTPPEQYMQTLWSSTSEHIIKLITLKLQVLQAFQS